MAAQDEAAGMAALSICESVLIALVEKGVLDPEEARSALEDAAAAHRGRDAAERQNRLHEAAEQIIERLMTQMSAARQTPGRQA